MTTIPPPSSARIKVSTLTRAASLLLAVALLSPSTMRADSDKAPSCGKIKARDEAKTVVDKAQKALDDVVKQQPKPAGSLQTAQAQLAAAEQERTKAAEAVKQAQAELEAFRKKNADKLAGKDTRLQQIPSAEELQQKISQAEAALGKADKQVRSQLEGVRMENRTLGRAIQGLQRTIETLSRKLEEGKGSEIDTQGIRKCEEAIEKLQAEVKANSAKIQELEKRLFSDEDDRAAIAQLPVLRSQLAERKQLERLGAENDRLGKNVQDVQRKQGNADTARDKAAANVQRIKQREQEIQTWEANRKQAEQAKADAEAKLKAAETDLATTMTAKDAAIKSGSTTLTEVETEITQATKTKDEKKAEIKAKLVKLQAKRKGLEEKKQFTPEKQAKYKELMDRLKKDWNDAKKEFDKAKLDAVKKLESALTPLEAFDCSCFPDAQQLLQKLHLKINDIQQLKASLPSDMEGDEPTSPPATGGPKVTIDSLKDNQMVPPGEVLQVAVSALSDPDLKDLKLEVAGAAVESGPTNPTRTFPAGTKESKSQVFAFKVKKEGFDKKNPIIVIKATATDIHGKTTTQILKVRVADGGKGSDLVYQIMPSQPAPGQTVNVTITVVNATPGTRVSYTVVGTDKYHQQGTLEVDAKGQVHFSIPGGAKGVKDVVEATLDGSSIKRQASYHF